MKVYLVSKAYLPFGYGICLPWGIYVRKDSKNVPYVVAHEKEHEKQIEKEGSYFKWIMKYLWLLIKHGYQSHPMEVEARNLGSINQWSYQEYANLE